MVPVRTMDDDYYVYDEARHMLLGRRRGRKYQLGDVVTVKVVETNLTSRTVDLKLVSKK
jgi:ribonuclease R